MAAAASTRPYRVPDDRSCGRRECALEVVGGGERRPGAKQPDDAGDERRRDRGRAADAGAAAERRDRRAVRGGELDPLAVARERGPLARRRRGGNGDRLGEGRRELGSRVRLVPGRRHDEHARGAGTDDGIPKDLGRPLAVDARVDDCGAMVDGVVDRRCGIHVEGDPVCPKHAERHDAAPEARPDAADAVVRTGGCGSRDCGAMPVASGVRRVRVVVDEVVPGTDASGEVGV